MLFLLLLMGVRNRCPLGKLISIVTKELRKIVLPTKLDIYTQFIFFNFFIFIFIQLQLSAFSPHPSTPPQPVPPPSPTSILPLDFVLVYFIVNLVYTQFK